MAKVWNEAIRRNGNMTRSNFVLWCPASQVINTQMLMPIDDETGLIPHCGFPNFRAIEVR
jgi:hypothetical protein